MKDITGKYKNDSVVICQTMRVLYRPSYFFGLFKGAARNVTLQVCLFDSEEYSLDITFPEDLKIKNIEKVFAKEFHDAKLEISKMIYIQNKTKSKRYAKKEKMEFDEFVRTRRQEKIKLIRDDTPFFGMPIQKNINIDPEMVDD